ncbi:hypothetical protein U1872_08060 [Sphingomonas sp. RB3P16]|uniref:hypothetical protein n=1 Tax=Parasphingomonas frigoris TaxID=3096163 RepID=UPI002FC92A02
MTHIKIKGSAGKRQTDAGRFMVNGQYIVTEANQALRTFVAPIAGLFDALVRDTQLTPIAERKDARVRKRPSVYSRVKKTKSVATSSAQHVD